MGRAEKRRNYRRIARTGLIAALFAIPGAIPIAGEAIGENSASAATGSVSAGSVSTGTASEDSDNTEAVSTDTATADTTRARTTESAALQRRGSAALDLIAYPWQERLPEWDITFHPGKEGVYGYTLVPEQKIEIYIRPEQPQSLLAHVIAHEIGHAVDVTLNDKSERQSWQKERNIKNQPWWPDSGANDFSTGAGDFAESFAAWQLGPHDFRSNLGPPPTDTQINALKTFANS